ncbi:MAG TPA: cellulase family glycosylhydrolase [Tepidisphaeraceae bacterium]|nr:cellulase family glycosylhydrolase [Tepidisphaeraceae bacterium]
MIRSPIAFLAALALTCSAALGDRLPLLHADGTRLVDANGNVVHLKGCNLGNWFMIEPWMLGNCIEARDQFTIFATLRDRFGEDAGNHLIDLYRGGYITPRDFDIIKSFGFNLVRLPFDYRMVQDDTPPYPIRADAFKWLDHAVDMADAAGVYIILDLHGAPGGQSLEMHTGKAGVNQFYTNPEDQDRLVAIWHALADHFQNRSAVAAYDLLNEPYSDHHHDVRPVLKAVMPRVYSAIRQTGDQHVVFFPGPITGGIQFYGDPHARGWTNIGFTEHTYAGLFGKDKPTIANHLHMLGEEFARRKAYLDRIGVPYYLGEFNVVRDVAGGPAMMRRYYDRAAEFDWSATMWSYKLIKRRGGMTPDPWFMVTNAHRLPQLDLQTSSYEDFERFFTELSTMDLTVNEPLRAALTDATPPALPQEVQDTQPN